MNTKKAQNLIEIGLLASVIVVITISVFTIYNNQKLNLAKMSKTTFRSVAISNLDANPQLKDKTVPSDSTSVKAVETAGALSTTISSAQLEKSLSSLTVGDLTSKGEGNKSLIDLANNLIEAKGGTAINSVDESTVSTLTNLLSTAKGQEGYDAFQSRFSSILSK